MTSKISVYIANAYRFFKSPKMTVIIIAVLSTLYTLSLVIPQKVLFLTRTEYEAWKAGAPLLAAIAEATRLNEITVAPVTMFFLSMFFVNLVIVLGTRIPGVLQRAYVFRRGLPLIDRDVLKKSPTVRCIAVSKDHAAPFPGIRRFLKKRFWSVPDGQAPDSLFAIKNRYSPFGFLLFHVSFLLCLIGGLLILYTRFTGHLMLTEGQVFNADLKQFRKINREPKIMKALPAVGINLERVSTHYEKDAAMKKYVTTDLDVKMQISYKNTIDDVVVRINQPVNLGALSILAEQIGVSPLFVLRSSEGKELDGGYINLNVLHGGEDSFQFEGSPYTYFIKLYTDYAVKDGVEQSLSKELKNLMVRIRIEKEKKVVYEGRMGMGERVSFDAYSLSFEHIRYWVDFLVIREYGDIPLFMGFLFGVIGLIMRLVFYQKTLKIAVEDAGQEWLIWIDGWSEYYPNSFSDDLTALVADLKNEVLSNPDTARLKQGGNA